MADPQQIIEALPGPEEPAEETNSNATDKRMEPPAPGVLDVLEGAEGFSAVPYCGPNGWMHDGIGFLMTEEEGRAIACEKWTEHAAIAQEWAGYDVWEGLNEVRRAVLTEVAYMTGGPNLRGFVCLARALGSPNMPEPTPEDCEYLTRGLTGYQGQSQLRSGFRRFSLTGADAGYTTPCGAAMSKTTPRRINHELFSGIFRPERVDMKGFRAHSAFILEIA